MIPLAIQISILLFLPILCHADPQFSNYAPFSGAIYIVNPNGEQITTTGTNWCPSHASLSCSSIGQPSCCCPASYTCASPANANGLIGCCPPGNTCGGVINVAQISTVTVQAPNTAVVYVAPPPVFTTYAAPPEHPVQQGFCSTMVADGPGLPAVRQGHCGTILVISEGAWRWRGVGVGSILGVGLLHLILGLCFES